MENKTENFELLGRILDGRATLNERQNVLLNLSDGVFRECLAVALRAIVLNNNKRNKYERTEWNIR
ncbi:hypothetical protein [Mediterranea massiliensis]|uniref:hypothetical protein n=1 Tax=Mediterranea massiliensis TaxID=1841865 RepID=UPI0023F36CE8|nr:hypothetical protein [Mediterranea massiliensis]